MNYELQIIKRIANEFREQILEGKIRFIESEKFPIGDCGNASDLLIGKLNACNYSDVEYVWGRYRDRTHG